MYKYKRTTSKAWLEPKQFYDYLSSVRDGENVFVFDFEDRYSLRHGYIALWAKRTGESMIDGYIAVPALTRIIQRIDEKHTPSKIGGRTQISHMMARRKHRANYPKRDLARYQTSRMIASGELIKAPCEVCGSLEVQAHHDDYNKPSEVRWLCRKHHVQWHKDNDPKYPTEDPAYVPIKRPSWTREYRLKYMKEWNRKNKDRRAEYHRKFYLMRRAAKKSGEGGPHANRE